MLDEVPGLLKENLIPHSGGTGLLMGDLSRKKGLIDLGHLPLKYVKTTDDSTEIGAMATYADVVRELGEIRPNLVLVSALGKAASTPLRNRITVGGSIAFAPIWSDIIGPLVALDAEITLIGAISGKYPVAGYIKDSGLKKQTLITSIEFAAKNWQSYYHRHIRTKFDFPAFTINILISKEANLIDDARIVITGNTNRFTRLTDIEEMLTDKTIGEIEIGGIGENLDIKFAGKKQTSPEYLRYLVGVELERGLREILKD